MLTEGECVKRVSELVEMKHSLPPLPLRLGFKFIALLNYLHKFDRENLYAHSGYLFAPA